MSRAETIIAPPYVFIPLVKSMLRTDFQIAAQNCWKGKGGAFTGEIRYHSQNDLHNVVIGESVKIAFCA